MNRLVNDAGCCEQSLGRAGSGSFAILVLVAAFPHICVPMTQNADPPAELAALTEAGVVRASRYLLGAVEGVGGFADQWRVDV